MTSAANLPEDLSSLVLLSNFPKAQTFIMAFIIINFIVILVNLLLGLFY